MLRFVLAVALSAVVVGIAPFVAEIRDQLKEGLGDSFRQVLAIAFAVPVAAAFVAVIGRIRRDRLRRYLLLAGGLVLMAWQLLGWSRADADVNAVERIHFVFYGGITVCFFVAYRPRGDLSVLALTWLSSTIVAVLDEGVQWASEVRTGEIFDVGINVYASLCTLLLCLAWVGPDDLDWRLPRAARPALARHLAGAVLVVSAFLHLAHLGHEIDDPEVGAFRSYFTAAELRELGAERGREWAAAPPGELRPLGFEDYYRSEAGWHVRHRNEALAAGDLYVAAKENEILERYYAPFLKLRDRAGRFYALNPDERRRTAAGRPSVEPYPYRSTVFRDPLRIWTVPSKPVLWLVALLACGLLLWASRRPTSARAVVAG